MSHLSKRVIAKWTEAGALCSTEASPGDLARLEQHLQIALPSEVRDLYSLANGMVDFSWDQSHVSFWSIARILCENETVARSDAHGAYVDVAFADVLISSWYFWFRIRPCRANPLSVVIESTDEEIASFGDFLERYLDDPSALCL
jgi:hypothetical protein